MAIFLQLVGRNTLHFFWLKQKILLRVKLAMETTTQWLCSVCWWVTSLFWLLSRTFLSWTKELHSVRLREVFQSIEQRKSQRIRQIMIIIHLYSNSNFSKSSFPISRELVCAVTHKPTTLNNLKQFQIPFTLKSCKRSCTVQQMSSVLCK